MSLPTLSEIWLAGRSDVSSFPVPYFSYMFKIEKIFWEQDNGYKELFSPRPGWADKMRSHRCNYHFAVLGAILVRVANFLPDTKH
jgi:hypothetical protein